MQRFFRAADSLRPFVAEDLRRGRRRRSCDAGAGPVQGSPGARASPEDGAGDQGGAVGQFLGQKMGQVMGQDGQRMPKIYIKSIQMAVLLKALSHVLYYRNGVLFRFQMT